MNKIKVQDFCNAYSNALNLNNSTKDLIIELMQNIISKYEQVIPPIPASIDESSDSYLIKPVNGVFSIEDFFLNRLMRNIWDVSLIDQKTIDEGFADSSTKGQFVPSNQMVMINEVKQEKQFDRFKNYFKSQELFEKEKKKAIKKVMMHEFEHGLQTRYDHELNFNYRSTYKKISDELEKMPQYRSIIQTYDEIPKSIKGWGNNYLSTGCHIGSALEGNGKKNYKKVYGSDNLNEILNESESLLMVERRIPIVNTYIDSGNAIAIFNSESSNCLITNYGFLFKTVFGDIDSFELMYLDPLKAFQKFNSRFNDIFQSCYKSDKDAIEIFINAITEIKENATKREENHLKLCTALAKCLEKRINNFYHNSGVTNDQMQESINRFKYFSMSNKDSDKEAELEHIKILVELKEKVNSRNVDKNHPTFNNQQTAGMQIKPSLQQYNNDVPLKPIPTFNEVKSYAIQYELVVDEKDNNAIKIIDNKTGKVVTDKDIEQLAIFSNIWLFSAGLRRNNGEIKEGISDAFNENAQLIYDYFVKSVNNNLSKNGNIDSISIFTGSEALNNKNSYAVIANLFRSDYQSKFLDDFFRERVKVNNKVSSKAVTTLYNIEIAGTLAYDNITNDVDSQRKAR